MYDNAPPIVRLGIPAYVWLNDDVHGVNGPHATVPVRGSIAAIKILHLPLVLGCNLYARAM